MLRMDEAELDEMEARYPGIKEQILRYEAATLPSCSRCGSDDTADVQIGLIGRTMQIGSATSKFKLIPNGPKRGRYFCNACNEFFDEETPRRV